jgi:leader peptidase (prepilin peptidase)/N-methyltransferase
MIAMPSVLDDVPPMFLRTLAVLFGLVWGSFLNVVIYRTPRGMSVAFPASHCPRCGSPVASYDNIPILSFAILRRRSRCCREPISWRYPIVEAIGGVLSLAILEAIILRLPPTTPLHRAAAVYLADFALALALVAGAFIDLEHMYIPDAITFGGTVLGTMTASFRDQTLVGSLLGAAVGFAVVWLPFIVVYPRVRGVVGMGLGDAKLLMLAGAWFGWGGALWVLGLAAVQGSLAAIVTLLLRGRIEEPAAVRSEREATQKELEALSEDERAEVERALAADPLAKEPGPGLGQARVAFGPFLSVAVIETMLFGCRLKS